MMENSGGELRSIIISSLLLGCSPKQFWHVAIPVHLASARGDTANTNYIIKCGGVGDPHVGACQDSAVGVAQVLLVLDYSYIGREKHVHTLRHHM